MRNKSSVKKIYVIIIIALIVADIVMAEFVIYFSPIQRIKRQLSFGDKYLMELNYDDAILAYEVALRIDPKKEDAYVGLARAYIGKGDYEKALENIERGITEIGETDTLFIYKENIEERIEEEKREKERKKDLNDINVSDNVEPQNKDFEDGNHYLEKALSQLDMRIILMDVIDTAFNDNMNSFDPKKDDFWWIITVYAQDALYSQNSKIVLPDTSDPFGRSHCGDKEFKQLSSVFDSNFNGEIDYDMVKSIDPRYVIYDEDKDKYIFEVAGDRGELDEDEDGWWWAYVDLTGYACENNKQFVIYGMVYAYNDGSQEKKEMEYWRINTVKNQYAEKSEDPVFLLSVENAEKISHEEYISATKDERFVTTKFN